MQGRTWKNLSERKAEDVQSYILANGGSEVVVQGPHEVWRIKFSDCTLTYYQKGTLYSTQPKSDDPAVFTAWAHIDSIVGSAYILPTEDFLIGLDETGKGEIIGHTVLTGIVFPKDIFAQIDLLIGPADTKKRHKFNYWDDLFRKLDSLREAGLDFVVEKVPPWHVDRYNLNKIMDVSYQRILSIFLRRVEIKQCRIVLDNYGIGGVLERFLKFLQNQGAEVVVTSKSEDVFLEAKAASIISKRIREAVMQAINSSADFKIDGLTVGTGNAGDFQTLEWLKKWHSSGKQWPWFVKRSFQTIRKIEGKSGKPSKVMPPIREKLLVEEFKERLRKGNLSIKSLSLVCPTCGSILKTAAFANFAMKGVRVSELKCPNTKCAKFIKDAGITLRYYCGYVIPDSSAIQQSLISNDLIASKFFENFTIVLVPVVRKECDGTPRGKRELQELTRYDAMGRIRLETVGKLEEVPDNLPNEIRDERIIDACVHCNCILLTADKSMGAFAAGKNIFTIIA